MPSDSANYLAKLPALAPLKYIDRPVSASEYYHASVGASRHTLESPRMVFFILRGSLKRGTDDGSDRELLTQAIARVAAVNPVLRDRKSVV